MVESCGVSDNGNFLQVVGDARGISHNLLVILQARHRASVVCYQPPWFAVWRVWLQAIIEVFVLERDTQRVCEGAVTESVSIRSCFDVERENGSVRHPEESNKKDQSHFSRVSWICYVDYVTYVTYISRISLCFSQPSSRSGATHTHANAMAGKRREHKQPLESTEEIPRRVKVVCADSAYRHRRRLPGALRIFRKRRGRCKLHRVCPRSANVRKNGR